MMYYIIYMFCLDHPERPDKFHFSVTCLMHGYAIGDGSDELNTLQIFGKMEHQINYFYSYLFTLMNI